MQDQAVLGLCRRLVAIPSYGFHGGESAIIQYLSDRLSAIPGLVLNIIAGKPGKPNLICSLQGRESGPTVFVCCHVDAFYSPPGDWSTNPLEGVIVGDDLQGAGSSDAKGGLAATVIALERLSSSGGIRAGQLLIAFTADEDAEGRWGLPWLIDENLPVIDAALGMSAAGFESDYDGLPLASRGFINLRVKLKTERRGFTWNYTRSNPHAVALAASLIGDLEAHFIPQPAYHALFPNGHTLIAGCPFRGGEPGSIPDEAEFIIECRTVPGTNEGTFLTDVNEFIRSRIHDAEIDIDYDNTWLNGHAIGSAITLDHPLAQAALSIVRECGYPSIRPTGQPMYMEIAALASRGIPILPAMGPGRTLAAHLPNERANIFAIERSAIILQKLLMTLLVPRGFLL